MIETARTRFMGIFLLVFLPSLAISTTIHFNSGRLVNAPITNDFGDRISHSDADFSLDGGATPHIDLTWSALKRLRPPNKEIRWEFHSWKGGITDDGGVMQLNGSLSYSTGDQDPFKINNVHQILFTPDRGYSVQIDKFNFIGDTEGDTYQYNWRVIDVHSHTVIAQGKTPQWTTDHTKTGRPTWDGAPSVKIYCSGNSGAPLLLQLTQSNGSTGDGFDIAIDNLQFREEKAPSIENTLLQIGGVSFHCH